MRVFSLTLLLFLVTPFLYDNGPDPVSDGYFRVVDENGLVGYANSSGVIQIKPQFAFAYPFKDGVAKVTYSGKMIEVSGSNGEYHKWISDDWFCIDKLGNRLECKSKLNDAKPKESENGRSNK